MRPKAPADAAAADFDMFRYRLDNMLDHSSMTRWRQRIVPERLDVLLAEMLVAAERGKALKWSFANPTCAWLPMPRVRSAG